LANSRKNNCPVKKVIKKVELVEKVKSREAIDAYTRD